VGSTTPGDHQIGEHRIAQVTEPQPGVDPSQGLVEQPGVGGHHPPDTIADAGSRRARGIEQHRRLGFADQRRDRRRGLDVEVENCLGWVVQQLAGRFQQHPQLGLGMRRTQMLHDPLPAPDVLGDLHRGGARGRAHAPHEGHQPTLRTRPSA
jgi:hypothetical protein